MEQGTIMWASLSLPLLSLFTERLKRIILNYKVSLNYYFSVPGPGSYILPSEFGLYESKHAKEDRSLSPNKNK